MSLADSFEDAATEKQATNREIGGLTEGGDPGAKMQGGGKEGLRV